jgi:hypothetical protein
MTSNWCSGFKRKITKANINCISINNFTNCSSYLQRFCKFDNNSFKTQVAILDNECGCLLVTIPRKQRYSEDWKLIFLNSSILVLNPLALWYKYTFFDTITSSKSYTLCRRLLIDEVALSNQWQFSHLFPGVYYIVRSAYILKILDELTTVKDVLL